MTPRRAPFEGLQGQPPQNAPAGPVGRGRSVPPPTPRHPSIPPRSRWPGQPRWSRQSPPSCDHANPAHQADPSTNPSRDAPCQTCSPDGPTFRVRAIRIHRSCGKHTRSSPTGGLLVLTCHIRASAMRTATTTQGLQAGKYRPEGGDSTLVAGFPAGCGHGIKRGCRHRPAPRRPRWSRAGRVSQDVIERDQPRYRLTRRHDLTHVTMRRDGRARGPAFPGSDP